MEVFRRSGVRMLELNLGPQIISSELHVRLHFIESHIQIRLYGGLIISKPT